MLKVIWKNCEIKQTFTFGINRLAKYFAYLWASFTITVRPLSTHILDLKRHRLHDDMGMVPL